MDRDLTYQSFLVNVSCKTPIVMLIELNLKLAEIKFNDNKEYYANGGWLLFESHTEPDEQEMLEWLCSQHRIFFEEYFETCLVKCIEKFPRLRYSDDYITGLKEKCVCAIEAIHTQTGVYGNTLISAFSNRHPKYVLFRFYTAVCKADNVLRHYVTTDIAMPNQSGNIVAVKTLEHLS